MSQNSLVPPVKKKEEIYFFLDTGEDWSNGQWCGGDFLVLLLFNDLLINSNERWSVQTVVLTFVVLPCEDVRLVYSGLCLVTWDDVSLLYLCSQVTLAREAARGGCCAGQQHSDLISRLQISTSGGWLESHPAAVVPWVPQSWEERPALSNTSQVRAEPFN